MNVSIRTFRKVRRSEQLEKLYPPWSGIATCPITGQTIRTEGYSQKDVTDRITRIIATTKEDYGIEEMSEISLEI